MHPIENALYGGGGGFIFNIKSSMYPFAYILSAVIRRSDELESPFGMVKPFGSSAYLQELHIRNKIVTPLAVIVPVALALRRTVTTPFSSGSSVSLSGKSAIF